MVFVVARLAAVTTPKKTRDEQAVFELGRRLRKISEKIAASGEKPLTRRELEREVAECR
jgi:hypothetical protein